MSDITSDEFRDHLRSDLRNCTTKLPDIRHLTDVWTVSCIEYSQYYLLQSIRETRGRQRETRMLCYECSFITLFLKESGNVIQCSQCALIINIKKTCLADE